MPTAGNFEIIDTVIFPNPYVPQKGNDLIFEVDLSQDAKMISARIFTTGFRKIIYQEWPGDFTAGRVDVHVKAESLSKLANGVYYVVFDAVNKQGRKAAPKKDLLVILR